MSSTHSTPPPAYVCKHCSAEHKDKASLKHYESGHIPKSSVVALHISCKESGDDNVVFLTETAGEVQETVKKAAALYMLPSYQEEKKRKCKYWLLRLCLKCIFGAYTYDFSAKEEQEEQDADGKVRWLHGPGSQA